MIEDEELRSLFQAESEEYLQSLDEGLLRLERNPQESATLEEMFRAAHSLKGTARMLGVGGVETLAHQLEDELGKAKRGRTQLTAADIDRMYVGVDGIRRFAESAVTGKPADLDLQRVLGQLRGAIPPDAPRPVEEMARRYPEPQEEPAPPPLPVEPAPAIAYAPPKLPFQNFLDRRFEVKAPEEPPPPAEPASAPETAPAVTEAEIVSEAPQGTDNNARPEEFRIQTMRIPPGRLDALMTLASELTVTTNRVERGLSTLEDMGEFWDEWHKELAAFRIQSSRWLGTWQSQRHGIEAQQLEQFQTEELERLQRLQALWTHLRETLYEDATRLSFVADQLDEGIRNIRLLPLTTIFGLYPRMVRDLSRSQAKEIQLIIQGAETSADKRILEEMKDPLMHMIRNSIDHGIEPAQEREQAGKPRQATILLRARQTATNVVIQLQDDGRGLDEAAIVRTALRRHLRTQEQLDAMTDEEIHNLIFAPGFSTNALVTDVSGRGVGMDVVRTNVERLKGSIRVDSVPGKGCTFTIYLPLTLATTRVLLVEVQGYAFALPVESVYGLIQLDPADIFTIEGRQTFVRDGEAIPVVALSGLLEIRHPSGGPPKRQRRAGSNLICAIVTNGAEKVGLLVDDLLDEQEVLLKPLGPLLKRVRNVSAVTILGAGEVCMILNVQDIVRSSQRVRQTAFETPQAVAAAPRRKVILLAEDSITTRTQEKRILESAGYEVVTAVDGADAFQKLPTREFDAVVTDVEMPNMNGLDLAQRIRQDKKYQEMPIILVTSLASDDDKQRGAEVGANAYITKGTFEQKVLLDTLRRLV